MASSPHDLVMTLPEYQRIQAFLSREAGISLGPAKQTLVMGRLGKRLRATSCPSYDAYLRLLNQDAEERQRAIDLLTTNETYFFREPKHFAFLAEQAIPAWNNQENVRIWSAASSSGEEAYSIAMVLAERRAKSWEIFGSDLSSQVLSAAEKAIYPMMRAEKIPRPYLKRYCLRGMGKQEGFFSIAPEIRRFVKFSQINLNSTLPKVGAFDMIFLRNILIYFEVPEKKAICQRLLQQLRPGGFFLVGHSESLNGIVDGLQLIQPAIYRKE